jgi:Flp pilus assembly protein TadD
VSVVLDALRRARFGRGSGGSSASAATPHPPVPAALLRAPSRRRATAKTRWGMLAGVAMIAAAIYAGVRLAPMVLQREAAVQPVVTPPVAQPATIPAVVQDPPAVIQAPDEPQPVDAVASAALPAPVVAQPRRSVRRSPSPPPPVLQAPSVASEPAKADPHVPAPAPVAAATNHFELAVRHHNLGNFEQALKHYLAVLDADEFNTEARNNLGLLYHQRGLTDDAAAQFRRALLINPQYLRARSNLAVVLMNAGRLAEARAELRAALAIEPQNVDLLVNMALLEKADGQPEQAKETLIKAIGRQPTHAVANYNLALLYEESGNTGRAHDHYAAFLKTAGPEHGTLLDDVRRRVDAFRAETLDAVKGTTTN